MTNKESHYDWWRNKIVEVRFFNEWSMQWEYTHVIWLNHWGLYL